MIDIPALLTPNRVKCQLEISSKKRALQTLADLLCTHCAANDRGILDHLLSRERLGTTGLGNGIAIPHSRIDGLDKPLGALITLNQAVDFDAVDDQPVDVLFALLIPEVSDDTHLALLAGLAAGFSSESFPAELRAAHSDHDLLECARRWPTHPHTSPS